jgi:tetratricopeptide (TPR) repeat protein
MEVAVHLAKTIRSNIMRRIPAGFVLAVAVAGLAGAAGGCGDVVTYAGESRQQGIKLYNAGQYPEAAGSFSNAIKQRPQDYESYYYLGRTYESMKNYHQAVGAYRTSLSVMSNSLKGAEDKAFRQKVVDGLASSIAAGRDVSLEQAAFVKTGGPKTGEDYYILAKAKRINGDVDSALADYAKAGKLDPRSFVVAKEHGLFLAQLNQRTKAAAELRRAYALNYAARKPEDEQVNQALRGVGVIPGPSLAEGKDLFQPIVPSGPIPEWNIGSPEQQAKTNNGQ